MLSPELLQLAKVIELSARKKAQHSASGQFQSAFQGEGLEFNEVRPYTPGEDTRRIDWNVSARSGSPYTKTFYEDRNINVVIVLDISPSMQFGSNEKSKSDIAIEIVGLLLLLSAIHKHKSTLVAFSNQVDLFLPLKHGKEEVLRGLTRLVAVQEQQRGEQVTTDYNQICHFLQSVIKKRGILFFLSDFLSVEDPQIFATLRKKLKLNLFHFYDLLEQTLSSSGFQAKYLLADMENKQHHAIKQNTFKENSLNLKEKYPSEYLSLCANDFKIAQMLIYFNRKKHFHKAL